MLFNSYIFILLFLPLTALLFHVVRNQGFFRCSIFILVMASITYYGWWNPRYLFLLIPLIVFDYGIAHGMRWARSRSQRLTQIIMVFGILVNLGILCYYKYTKFIVDNANQFLGWDYHVHAIVLPIGISFFTFQKIAFIIDYYQNKIESLNFLDYTLFVTFFPQLIAGPIVHHSEVMPQFSKKMTINLASIALGITFFIIGLAKKVLLADVASQYASPVFNAVAQGHTPDFWTAWSASLCYSAQLYFDFSAYSDMAIGIGQLCGIHLPINFHSPYKSINIIDFWRRWHMTLSRFLRDYVYILLGGNKKGRLRRYANLIITMVLGGIWHGAGWTFLVWGALHGAYLMINHGFHHLRRVLRGTREPSSHIMWQTGSRIITFIAVMIGWVFFRSVDLESAIVMLKGLIGQYGFAVPESFTSLIANTPVSNAPIDSGMGLLVALGLLGITWFAPNTQQLTSYIGPKSLNTTYNNQGTQTSLTWKPNKRWAVTLGCLLALCLMMFSKVSEFIYFQF